MAETTAPAGETKADKFKRLAIPRTEKALAAIANIGGLASKTNYEYTEGQATQIMKALEAEVVKLAARFTNPTAPTSGGFSFAEEEKKEEEKK